MDRKIALVICFSFGLVMFAQYFSNHPVAMAVNRAVLDWWQIIFAFALIVGIVVGTYSSIYVASPILLAWQRRK